MQILSNEDYEITFQPLQPAAFFLLSLKVPVQGYAIGLLFFGVYCMLIGCVVFKSQREPELMGIPYIISGAGILINNFTMFRSGRFTNPLFTFLAIPIFIGEIPFCLWLYI